MLTTSPSTLMLPAPLTMIGVPASVSALSFSRLDLSLASTDTGTSTPATASTTSVTVVANGRVEETTSRRTWKGVAESVASTTTPRSVETVPGGVVMAVRAKILLRSLEVSQTMALSPLRKVISLKKKSSPSRSMNSGLRSSLVSPSPGPILSTGWMPPMSSGDDWALSMGSLPPPAVRIGAGVTVMRMET